MAIDFSFWRDRLLRRCSGPRISSGCAWHWCSGRRLRIAQDRPTRSTSGAKELLIELGMYAPGYGLDGAFHIFLVKIAGNLGFDGFHGYGIATAKFINIKAGHLGLKLGYFTRLQGEYVFFDSGREGASTLHAKVGLRRRWKSESFIDFILKFLRFLAMSRPFANVSG